MQNPTIEEVEKYWSKKPCNIAHSKLPIGSKEYFREVYKRKFFVEPHIWGFAEFKKWSSKNVLEIGVGLGATAMGFAQHGAKVTGIELSETTLELCKKSFKEFDKTADLYLGNAENLSYYVPCKHYDLIFSFGVIHHSPQTEKIMKEIHNLADWDTTIKLMVYAKWSWKGLYFFMTDGWRFGFNYNKCIQWHAEAQSNCPVAKVYSAKEVKELCKDFEIVSMKKDHIFPYKIKDYIQYKYTKVWYFRYMPKKLFKWLEGKLGWHYLIQLKKK